MPSYTPPVRDTAQAVLVDNARRPFVYSAGALLHWLAAG